MKREGTSHMEEEEEEEEVVVVVPVVHSLT